MNFTYPKSRNAKAEEEEDEELFRKLETEKHRRDLWTIGNGLGYLENPDTVDYIIQDPRRFFIELRRRLVGPPTAACLPAGSEANAGVEALLGGFFVFISASELLGTEGFGIGVPRTIVGCRRGEAKARRMIGENGSPWMSEAGGMKKQGLHFATLSVM